MDEHQVNAEIPKHQAPPALEQSKSVDYSCKISDGLDQLKAIGDLLAGIDEDNVDPGTFTSMGQLIRDKAEEVKRMLETEPLQTPLQ